MSPVYRSSHIQEAYDRYSEAQWYRAPAAPPVEPDRSGAMLSGVLWLLAALVLAVFTLSGCLEVPDPAPDAAPVDAPDYFACWDVAPDQPCAVPLGFCAGGDGTAIGGTCRLICDRGACPDGHAPTLYDGYNCVCVPCSPGQPGAR